MKFNSRTHLEITNRRLVIGFLLILFLVGDGLIYWIYGPASALMGLLCLVGGLLPLLGITLILRGLDWIRKRHQT